MAVETERAVWSTAYINSLPDSSFLYIESGGSKDSEGKTTPRSLRHFPYKDQNGKVDLPHLRNALARIPQATFLSSSQKDSLTAKAQKILQGQQASEMPKENLFRAIMPGPGLLERDGGDGGPVMNGHFAVFDQWTEIHSLFEGHFMERFAPGAFRKTISEAREGMRVLFQHGRDPQVGDKPLGPIDDLREDDSGAYYEVPLLEAPYVREAILPGLRAGLYGASMRFRAIIEEVNEEPEASAYNPNALPERTVKEAEVREFGPVTFPAYAGATAGVRSLTDRFILGVDAEPDKLRELYDFLAVRLDAREEPALSGDGAGEDHSDVESRDPVTPHKGRGKSRLYGLGRGKEKESWRL